MDVFYLEDGKVIETYHNEDNLNLIIEAMEEGIIESMRIYEHCSNVGLWGLLYDPKQKK